MDVTEYAFPCLFLGDINAPAASIPRTGIAGSNLLGLGGVVDKLRLIFDGTPGPNAAHGYLIVEKR